VYNHVDATFACAVIAFLAPGIFGFLGGTGLRWARRGWYLHAPGDLYVLAVNLCYVGGMLWCLFADPADPLAVRCGILTRSLGLVIAILGGGLVVWADSVNPSFSPSVVLDRDGYVVESGPYAIVRHPGYLGMLLGWLGISLSGSVGLFLPLSFVLALTIRRIYREEACLRAVRGVYVDYERRVPWRLLPGCW
jgi:protein-S-isoprenylcysteine O-methyltransferase Ste14